MKMGEASQSILEEHFDRSKRSSNLALLNINFDIKHDLDLMVDTYIKLYTSKSELPTR